MHYDLSPLEGVPYDGLMMAPLNSNSTSPVFLDDIVMVSREGMEKARFIYLANCHFLFFFSFYVVLFCLFIQISKEEGPKHTLRVVDSSGCEFLNYLQVPSPIRNVPFLSPPFPTTLFSFLFIFLFCYCLLFIYLLISSLSNHKRRFNILRHLLRIK